MLIFAIGDIHGEFEKMVKALNEIHKKTYMKKEPYKVIFLGDYVDRGPDSRRVVNMIKQLVTNKPQIYVALKGNHEDMMQDALEGRLSAYNMWSCNGGSFTELSYKDNEKQLYEHAEWFKTLPLYYETENHVFCHAGMSADYDINNQPEAVLLWTRRWEDAEHDFGKHVVYGHTPREQVKRKEYSTGLDTGACFGGKLTVGVFDSEIKSGPIDLIQID